MQKLLSHILLGYEPKNSGFITILSFSSFNREASRLSPLALKILQQVLSYSFVLSLFVN